MRFSNGSVGLVATGGRGRGTRPTTPARSATHWIVAPSVGGRTIEVEALGEIRVSLLRQLQEIELRFLSLEEASCEVCNYIPEISSIDEEIGGV